MSIDHANQILALRRVGGLGSLKTIRNLNTNIRQKYPILITFDLSTGQVKAAQWEVNHDGPYDIQEVHLSQEESQELWQDLLDSTRNQVLEVLKNEVLLDLAEKRLQEKLAILAMRTQQISYATLKEGVFHNFYPSAEQMRLCTSGPYHKVCIIADPAGTYYTWHDFEKDEFLYTHCSRIGVAICFPYPIKSYEDRGRGKLIPCRIEYLGVASHQSEKPTPTASEPS
jgi:hypothetical protein